MGKGLAEVAKHCWSCMGEPPMPRWARTGKMAGLW
jgi:hypothetical protein